MSTDTPSISQAADAPPRRRRVMRRVTVTRVTQLSPRMVRVTFTGDDLGAFGWNGPAAHIKLVFPEEGQAEPPMPQPEGPRPTRMRTYTPRRFDPTIPELDVEFVLHGEGPASAWAAQAQVGQALILAGPGPSYQIAPDATWFLLAGDDTALPAIETILDVLPAGARARVLVEVVDAHEERPLVSAAQLDVTWLHRGEEVAQAGRALEAALRAELLPAGDERSRRRGAGMELSEVRAYQPGDDIRFIDWNITARTDQSYVREATVERALDVWMVVDSPIPARPPLRGGRAGRCRGLRLPRPQPGGFSNRL